MFSLVCTAKVVEHVNRSAVETTTLFFFPVFCRGQVSVREFQRAAGEGRRPPQVTESGRLQEEEGADLMPPVHHSESTMHV